MIAVATACGIPSYCLLLHKTSIHPSPGLSLFSEQINNAKQLLRQSSAKVGLFAPQIGRPGRPKY
jgi:hypothetical protein